MLDWSNFFYAKLQEEQYIFAQNMNLKTEGDFFKLLDAWRKKQILPIYQDMALHKVYQELYNKPIPKSTVSTWINRVPELLENEDLLTELLEPKKVVKKEETRYTYEEWCYIHRLEGEKLMKEYKAFMDKMQNPNLPDEQIMKMHWASRRLMNKINQYAMTMQDQETQKDILTLNESIIQQGKEKILKSIQALPDNLSPQNIKHISGSLNEAFMQNRLLKWESTDNVSLWISDIYKKILEKSRKNLSEPVQEWEIEVDVEKN